MVRSADWWSECAHEICLSRWHLNWTLCCPLGGSTSVSLWCLSCPDLASPILALGIEHLTRRLPLAINSSLISFNTKVWNQECFILFISPCPEAAALKLFKHKDWIFRFYFILFVFSKLQKHTRERLDKSLKSVHVLLAETCSPSLKHCPLL